MFHIHSINTFCENSNFNLLHYYFRAEKSEILNQDELQTADLKIEYFRNALSAIVKKLAPSSPSNDLDKLMASKAAFICVK